MRLIDIDKLTVTDIVCGMETNKVIARAVYNFLNNQPTIQPQGIDKDRLEHAIKLLEFCKQRHIDIATQLPHTVGIEAGKISCYEMALKVVRTLLPQPTTDVPDTNDGEIQQPTSDGWIPCGERLPSRGGEYWATIKIKGNYYVRKVDFSSFTKSWRGWVRDGDEVIAWQEEVIPQPYKIKE